MSETNARLLTEIVRHTIIAADMDRVSNAINEATGEQVAVWAISAITDDAGEIHGTFEGEILSRKGKDNPLYIEFKLSVARDA